MAKLLQNCFDSVTNLHNVAWTYFQHETCPTWCHMTVHKPKRTAWFSLIVSTGVLSFRQVLSTNKNLWQKKKQKNCENWPISHEEAFLKSLKSRSWSLTSIPRGLGPHPDPKVGPAYSTDTKVLDFFEIFRPFFALFCVIFYHLLTKLAQNWLHLPKSLMKTRQFLWLVYSHVTSGWKSFKWFFFNLH